MAELTDLLVVHKRKFLFRTYYTYSLRPCVIWFLAKFTKVRKTDLFNITIHNNLIPLPAKYDAITWGRSSQHAHISLKETYFTESLTMKQVNGWLEILVHETVHVPQINQSSVLRLGLLPYLCKHLYFYIKYGHEHSPLERRPIVKQQDFNAMNRQLDKTYHPYCLAKIFTDNLSENEKIKNLRKILKNSGFVYC